MTTQTQLIAQLQATVVVQGAALQQAAALITTVQTLQDTITALEARAAESAPGMAADPATADVLPELADLVAQLHTQAQAVLDTLAPRKLPPVVDVPAETQ